MKMLKRLAASPEEMRSKLSGLVEQAEKLRVAKPDNPIEAIEMWLSDLLDAERYKRMGENAAR